MKKRILGLLVVVFSLLISCSDDENENATTIEGTWKLTAWKSANAHDLNGDGTASTNLLNEFGCYNNELLVFNSNNTGETQSNSYANVTAILETGTTDSYTFDISCIEEQDNSLLTWSRNENTITLTEGGGETTNFNLDGNTMSFLLERGFEVFTSGDFENAVITEDLIFIYTKQ